MPSRVDEFWAQLQRNQGPQKTVDKGAFNKLWFGFSNDVEGDKERVHVTKNEPGPKPVAQPKLQDPGAAVSRCSPPTVQSSEVVTPEVLQQTLPKHIAALKDPDASARRNSLQSIKVLLAEQPTLPEDVVQDWMESQLGKALLRRFDDCSETCRELAVSLFVQLLKATPQSVLALLPYAAPVLEERIALNQLKSPVESSEEVRLQLCRLLVLLIQLGQKAIGAYAGEMIHMIKIMCEDPFYDINIEACTAVQQINAVLGMRLYSVSKEVVAALLPLTTHKRHRVRVCALQALKVIMHQGAHEMILEMVAWRDPNVVPIAAFYGDDLKVNFCGKLATDPHAQVRLEFLHTIGDWLLNLRERIDHEPRLMPYIISAINDENPQIQEEALKLLEQLGIQHEKDHEKDLKETVYYLPDEAHALGWQPNNSVASFVYGDLERHSLTAGGRQLLIMPGPCLSRPRLGARILVQGHFGRVVHPLVNELQTWQAEPRKRAALLLRTNLIFVEDTVHQHLQLLVPAFCKTIEEPEIAGVIADCCAVVACFVNPLLLLNLLAARIYDEELELGRRAAGLMVLAHFIRGAGARGAIDEHLDDILRMLEQEALLKSEDAAVRRSMMEVVRQLLQTCGPACAAASQRLLLVCLYLRSCGHGHGEVGMQQAAEVEGMMCSLAKCCGFAISDEHLASHRVPLLAKVDPSESCHVQLDLYVLARLLLSSSQEVGLLAAPDEAVVKVLDTQVSSAASTSTTDIDMGSNSRSAPTAGATQLANLGEACSSGRAIWSTSSVTVVLQHMKCQHRVLQSHPRAALLCLLALEALLSNCTNVVLDPIVNGQLLLDMILPLLQLQGGLMLVALRCLHIVCIRKLVGAELLRANMGAVGTSLQDVWLGEVPCRLQACCTVAAICRILHQHSSSQHGGPSQSTLEALRALSSALCARLDDPQEYVRSAALQAIGTLLEFVATSAALCRQRHQPIGAQVDAAGTAGAAVSSAQPQTSATKEDNANSSTAGASGDGKAGLFCLSIVGQVLRMQEAPGTHVWDQRQAVVRWVEQNMLDQFSA